MIMGWGRLFLLPKSNWQSLSNFRLTHILGNKNIHVKCNFPDLCLKGHSSCVSNSQFCSHVPPNL